MREAPLPRLEISRILPQQRWQNCSRHVVLDGPVRAVSTEALPVTGRPLPVAGLAVLRLADARQKAIPGDQNVIKRALRHNRELLLAREWRNLSGVFERQKVGQSVEQAIL